MGSEMLETVLRQLNNWFLDEIHEGNYSVEGSSIDLPFLKYGQYFRICGSVFNDGLHQYPAYDLIDESFDGSIWALAIPSSVVVIADEIAAWQEKNGEVLDSPYTSESFGGYTYTKRTKSNGDSITWQDVFLSRLKPYMKPREVGYVSPSRCTQ